MACEICKAFQVNIEALIEANDRCHKVAVKVMEARDELLRMLLKQMGLDNPTQIVYKRRMNIHDYRRANSPGFPCSEDVEVLCGGGPITLPKGTKFLEFDGDLASGYQAHYGDNFLTVTVLTSDFRLLDVKIKASVAVRVLPHNQGWKWDTERQQYVGHNFPI